VSRTVGIGMVVLLGLGRQRTEVPSPRRGRARLVGALAVLLALLVGCSGSGTSRNGFASTDSGAGSDDGRDAGAGNDAPPTLGLGGGGGEDAAASDGAPSCSNPDDLTGCQCPAVGQTQKCYVGDPAMAGVGVCTWGTQSCTQQGEFTLWAACSGYGVPTPAACDGVDHLCNGMPNASCTCAPGATQSCYTGPPGTIDVGICKGGTQTCENGTWGPCAGEVTPAPEICSDQLDHDCNGLAGCADPVCQNTTACAAQETTCTVGTTQPCYTGPPNSVNVGTCKAGTQQCVNGTWGSCTGEVTPTMEVCSDDLDHDCNGQGGCADAACASTDMCQSEVDTCNEGGMVYVMHVSYTGQVDVTSGMVSLCSGDAAGDGVSCGPTLGEGGTFNANCAGTYQVCGRVVSNEGCTIGEGCVMVVVPTDGATVTLAPFPGFGPVEGPCLEATYPSGSMSTSIDVTGTTTTGISVNRPNVATHIDVEVWGGGGGGSGSGGGGF